MILREYQTELISKIYQSWEIGNRKIMAQLPTGGGKTIVISAIVQNALKSNLKCLVLAHREELINQAVEKIEAITNEPVGVIKSGKKAQYDRDVQVGSVQSMARRLDSCPSFDLIIIDECFPAGTLVDGKPIESIEIGDLVKSFNTATGQVEIKPVTRLFKRSATQMVVVTIGQKQIKCTTDHPFYTQRGWISANKLTSQDLVYAERSSPRLSLLQEKLSSNKKISKTYEAECLLLDRVFQNSSFDSILRNNSKNKSQICQRSNEEQQSDGKGRCQIKGICNIEKNQTQAKNTGREWQTIIDFPSNAFGSIAVDGFWLDSGISSANQNQERQWLSNLLQNRYSSSSFNDSGRNRWIFPFKPFSSGTRSEKDGTLEWVRVDSVEVYQPIDNDGSRCCDVYNIEVADNHNYFVDGVLVHNCHHATSASYLNIINYYPNARVLGVTATPIRLDGKGFRGVFEDLVCGVTVAELIGMGNLSPYHYYGAARSMSTEGISKRGGDYKAEAIAEANPIELVGNQVVESYRQHLDGKRAIVFAIDCEQSDAIAQYLRAAGISAHHLDGMTPTAERASALDLFRNGEIQVLTNCALFDEGLDIPSLDGAILARPTASLSRYLQMVGRALRPHADKEHATIIDIAGNYNRHGMPDDLRVWTLDGVEKKQKERKKYERNLQTDRIELVVELSATNTEYVRINSKSVALTPELKLAIAKIDDLIAEAAQRGYKAAWCAYRLMDMAKKDYLPIEAWKYAGSKLGYHHKWADYKVEEIAQSTAI